MLLGVCVRIHPYNPYIARSLRTAKNQTKPNQTKPKKPRMRPWQPTRTMLKREGKKKKKGSGLLAALSVCDTLAHDKRLNAVAPHTHTSAWIIQERHTLDTLLQFASLLVLPLSFVRLAQICAGAHTRAHSNTRTHLPACLPACLRRSRVAAKSHLLTVLDTAQARKAGRRCMHGSAPATRTL